MKSCAKRRREWGPALTLSPDRRRMADSPSRELLAHLRGFPVRLLLLDPGTLSHTHSSFPSCSVKSYFPFIYSSKNYLIITIIKIKFHRAYSLPPFECKKVLFCKDYVCVCVCLEFLFLLFLFFVNAGFCL